MKIVQPSITIEDEINGEEILKKIERAGRTCYKSEDKITADSARTFIKNIILSGHHSVLEHVSITVRIVCDRGVSHELVRHRLCSFSQESSRYCSYNKDKFNNEITVIDPCFWEKDSTKYFMWEEAMKQAESTYMRLIELGATPQEARSVLPNSLKTEIVVTCNLREWMHILKMRISEKAHPQIRQVAFMILSEFKKKIPVVFDEINN